MKMFVASIMLGVVVLCGCSQNEISISNKAEAGVYFLFRGDQRYLPPNGSSTISDIPNGSFTYSTTYEIPREFPKYAAEADLAGTLDFAQNKTKVLILYSSTSNDSTYSVNLNLTTTMNQSNTTTAP